MSFTSLASSQTAVTGMGSGQRVRQAYTAEFKTTTERTLANGTTITGETTELNALDAEGRRFTATITPAHEEVQEHSVYHVFDPVARTNSTWTVPGKFVTVSEMPPAPQPGQRQDGCWSSSTVASTGARTTTASVSGSTLSAEEAPPVASAAQTAKYAKRESAREDLGTQTIQGVVARGTRTTLTTPAGAVGNDAPLVRITEIWMAPSLGLVLHEVRDDPQTGKMTKELVQLTLEAPDSGRFQIPEGYEVKTLEIHEIPCPASTSRPIRLVP